MRKHRLAECLLVDVIGLEWEQVHAEACRWEHVMSKPCGVAGAGAAAPPDGVLRTGIPSGLEELGEKAEADPFLDDSMVSLAELDLVLQGDRGRAPDRGADRDGRPADVHAAAGRGPGRFGGQR
ncbi:hypothetical protein SMICM17S_01649 [Streptomyces microflavus]